MRKYDYLILLDICNKEIKDLLFRDENVLGSAINSKLFSSTEALLTFCSRLSLIVNPFLTMGFHSKFLSFLASHFVPPHFSLFFKNF